MPLDVPYRKDEGGDGLDEFATEIRAAFPDEDWTPNRLTAMKEAIKICVKADDGGAYDEEGGEPPPPKGGSGLALIFGPKKKKGE